MKNKLALIAIAAMFALVGCGDDGEKQGYTCSTCVSEPEALSENDASGKGIYKGVVIGSSGTIKFDIANGGSAINAYLVLDEEEYVLNTEASYNSETGISGNFYGTMNETNDISIYFSANASGSEAYIGDVIIPGHPNAAIQIVKELSDALVMGFEGTYKGDASGTFNMAVRSDGENTIWSAISRHEGEDGGQVYIYYRYIDGEIESGILVGGDGDGLVITGEISGSTISGTWEEVFDEVSGTWSGKRTL